jgi:hypothetical protein
MKTVMLLAAGCLLAGCGNAEIADNNGPKSSDLRIVREFDETYSVQRYRENPGWTYLGGCGTTLEDAKRLKRKLETPYPDVYEESEEVIP